MLGHLQSANPESMERIVEYLRRVSPGIEELASRKVGPTETVEFRQVVAGQARPWRFGATNMSDGTLRGLGVLVALLQANADPPTLVGIEEPEIALHPAAVGILIDAIADATMRTQVLVTSHSPDLLEREDIDDRSIPAVASRDGVTSIGPVAETDRRAPQERLFTAGEMLRMDRLRPSSDAERISTAQLKLFEA